MCDRAGLRPGLGAERPGLRCRPRPHDGAILVETGDMEGDLGLVREGHRDGVTMHRVSAPRAGSDRRPLPPPRTGNLCLVSPLPALHRYHASHTPWTGNASRTRREQDTAPRAGQRDAGRRVEARDAREDRVPISWLWSVACRTGEGQRRSNRRTRRHMPRVRRRPGTRVQSAGRHSWKRASQRP